MCTALPPSRSPVITKNAATIHSLLWPTLALAAPLDGRDGPVAPRFVPPVRRRPKSGMTLPPVALRPLFLVRGGFFVPRRTLALPGPSRSMLPRASPLLEPALEIAALGTAPRGDGVQIDAPHHQEHGTHYNQREPAPPARRFPL